MKEINDRLEIELEKKISKYLQTMKWRQGFNEWKRYRIWQENYQELRVETLEKYTESLKNIRILDLGCGMGGTSVALKRSSANIISIDFNYDYCKITKLRGKRYELKMSIINAIGEQLPLKDGCLDIVICWEVLEHVQEPQKVLEEINRVLNPQGKLFISVINRYAFKDSHYHLYFLNWMPSVFSEWYIKKKGHCKDGKLCKDRQKLSEMHYFTFADFAKLAGECGFTVRDIKEEKILNADCDNLLKITQNLLNVLRISRLNIRVYRLMRYFWFSGYNLLLTKNKVIKKAHNDLV